MDPYSMPTEPYPCAEIDAPVTFNLKSFGYDKKKKMLIGDGRYLGYIIGTQIIQVQGQLELKKFFLEGKLYARNTGYFTREDYLYKSECGEFELIMEMVKPR